MSAGVLIVILLAAALGIACVLVLLAAFVCASAADAKEVVEARCERLDREARIARREAGQAYEEALLGRLRAYRADTAEQLGAEAEAFLQEARQ